MSYVKRTAAHSTEMKSTQAMLRSQWVAVGEMPECKNRKKRKMSVIQSINLNKMFSLPSSEPLSSHFPDSYWEDKRFMLKYLGPTFT